MGLLGGGNVQSEGPQQYTGTASGQGINLQGKNKSVNTGTLTNAKTSSSTKDVGNVTIKAAKGSTVNYTIPASNDQTSILDQLKGLFTGGDSGGGGGGITVSMPGAATASTLASSSVVKMIVIGVVIVALVLGWKMLGSKKP